MPTIQTLVARRFDTLQFLKMIEFRNPNYIVPPGSEKQILSHPILQNEAIELAIFQEHRYAFFFWTKWTKQNKLTKPPCLVSFDWHQDLCFPCETEKEWLDNLDITSDGDIAIFCWTKLAGNNDGHILSAAYLNLIGNVYVLCRQGTFESDWEDEEMIDKFGNSHIIKKFRTSEKLEAFLNTTEENYTYFDIDLDFYTYDNPYNGKGEKFTYMTELEMKNMLSVENSLIKWIFKRLCGFTIATEPEHCGGLLKSNKILDIINSIYFTPDIFTQNCNWKHKS